jgi:hypothetical protein
VPSLGCCGQKIVHHLNLQLSETSVIIPENMDLEEPSLQTLAKNEDHVIAEICWSTQ